MCAQAINRGASYSGTKSNNSSRSVGICLSVVLKSEPSTENDSLKLTCLCYVTSFVEKSLSSDQEESTGLSKEKKLGGGSSSEAGLVVLKKKNKDDFFEDGMARFFFFISLSEPVSSAEL